MSEHITAPRRPGRVVDAALSLGAVAGVVCMCMALGAVFFGITPLVFRSGSMAPAIPSGSLALARDVPADDIAPGAVVSVIADNGNRITHRVASVEESAGNSVSLVLKGDANAEPDATPYVVTDVTRVVFDVPYLGYAVAWSSTPAARAAGTILAVWLLVAVFGPRRRGRSSGRHRASATPPGVPGRAVHSGMSIVLVGALSSALIVVSPSAPARAAVTDRTVGQVTMTLGSAPRPASFTCTTQGTLLTNAVLSWPVVAPAFGYRLEFRATATGLLLDTRDIPAQASGTVSFAVTTGLLDLLPNSSTVHLISRVGTFWISPSPTLTHRITKALLSSSCATPGTVTSPGAVAGRQARSAPSGSSETTTDSGSSSPSSQTSGSQTPGSSSTEPSGDPVPPVDGLPAPTTAPTARESEVGQAVPDAASSSSSTEADGYR
ncbi:signal peptidase I [Gordonia sp. NPDC058843]|uniref:signal peptidase I n=1 Tax=Gordonia sp. NPDC058843 TaxID=3346648 RepID=UPI003681DB2A